MTDEITPVALPTLLTFGIPDDRAYLFLRGDQLRVDLSRLYPPFRRLWVATILNCHAREADYYATSGYRSGEEQMSLWRIGRRQDEDGTWRIVQHEDESHVRVVTRSLPFRSAHNFGCAGDATRDADVERAGLQPDFNLPDYVAYAEEGRKLGLEMAYDWKSFQEGPHAQLPLGRQGITMGMLEVKHKEGGVPAVWEFLENFSW